MVERAVCRALEVLALKQAELRLDAVCIVRGGGSSTDLGCWNSYEICAAIAGMPVPVITGIGHERDRVAADEVAHATAPTPTAAAELLCALARSADSDLREIADQMAALASQILAGAAHAIAAAQQEAISLTTNRASKESKLVGSMRGQCAADARRSLAPHADSVCRLHEALMQDVGRALRGELRTIVQMRSAVATSAVQETRQAGSELEEMTGEFTAIVRRNLFRQVADHNDKTTVLATLADRVIGRSRKVLGHLLELTLAYDPVHVLRRGFSITRNGNGKAVKSAADVAPGETIITRLASGQIASTITRTS
jgi:exodeoxyribonuclease VII large subunit